MTVNNLPDYQPSRIARKGDRAVVVGASMAGLFAARVLADAYRSVVVIERDDLPPDPESRDGVPQGGHPHLLLRAGQQTIEDFFPGFAEELLAAGGLLIDWSRDLSYYEEGGFVSGGPTPIPMYAASRPLFETVVRRRLTRVDGIEIRENCHFRRHETDPDGTAVTGIELWDEHGDVEQLAADLVVDATGRASRTAAWLDDIGYESPPVDEVKVDVTYGTMQLARPESDRRMLFVPPSTPRTTGGGAFPIEDDRWLVTLVGIHESTPPKEPSAYLEFARDLPGPNLGELLETNEWVDETINHYTFPTSIWRHYESLDRFPADLVVIGDAVASFNPIYGQGMSVSAMEALLLHQLLSIAGPAELPMRFFERSARLVRTAWRLSVGADFQFAETTGPKPVGTAALNWYLSRFLRGAHSDPVLADRFARVVMMESPPTTLIRPSTLLRVFAP